MLPEPTTILWPGAPSTRDPWDDACWSSLDLEGRFGAVFEAWDRWRTGHASEGDFAEEAARAGLTGPELLDRNKPTGATTLPSLRELARITLDPWPAAGVDAVDAVLGPASLFASAPLRLAAVAGAAFIRTENWPKNSFQIWCRGKPQPSAELRAALHEVELAPWTLWRVDSVCGDRATITDATGLGAQYQPEGPVRILGELPVQTAMAARVLRGPDGWVAHTVIPLSALPPRAEVDRWIRHETWLARTHQPGITREALLRKRPILPRRALERALRGRSPPMAVTSAL